MYAVAVRRKLYSTQVTEDGLNGTLIGDLVGGSADPFTCLMKELIPIQLCLRGARFCRRCCRTWNWDGPRISGKPCGRGLCRHRHGTKRPTYKRDRAAIGALAGLKSLNSGHEPDMRRRCISLPEAPPARSTLPAQTGPPAHDRNAAVRPFEPAIRCD